MQEPEAYFHMLFTSLNRSENPFAGVSAKYFGERERDLVKQRGKATDHAES